MVLAAAGATRAAESVEDVLHDAAQRFDRKDYAGAKRGYERATKLDPGSVRAWRGLGWSLFQLGDSERAFKVWSDLLRAQPNDMKTQLALAQAHEALSHWDEALGRYERILARNPKEASAEAGRTRTLLGRAAGHREAERYAEAESDLNAILKKQRSNFDAQFMLAQVFKATGRQADAMKLFRHLAQQGSDSRYTQSVADVLLEMGKVEEAIDYYQRTLRQDPDRRGAVLGLARARVQLQQYASAIEPLEAYVSRHPDDDSARGDLVRFNSAAGNFADAERHLRILAKRQPNESQWALKLAQNLFSAGKSAEAARQAEKVLNVEPDNVVALELMFHIEAAAGDKVAMIGWRERLAQVDPTAKRLDQLGDAYLELGTQHEADDDEAGAKEALQKSVAAFRRAQQADPHDTDAILGEASALRLRGDYRDAIAAARKVHERHPRNERALRELFESHLAREDYAGAETALRDLLKTRPGSLRLRHELARTQFRKGERQEAIDETTQLLQQPLAPSVPVLLYHGIAPAAATDGSMPVANFRSQMVALRDAGYQPINVRQLREFVEQGAPLPPKAVLITFDDARADSVRYADPVLKELGFHATMFTPVEEVGQHGSFTAVWETLRTMHESGRWEIQCHSYGGHRPIPLDAAGRTGAFIANRMWLERQRRLENHAEFVARLEQDYRRCGDELVKALPGLQLHGYAYPFGELGQKGFSNERKAVAVNKDLARRYFGIAFVQDPIEQVTRLVEPSMLPRFEVPWYFTGEDLIAHLRAGDARTSTSLVLADLYSWDGRYAEAEAIFTQLTEAGQINRADLLARRGRVGMWQGDYAEARSYLFAAAELEPRNRIVRQGLEQLDQRLSPSLTIDGSSSSDNRDRSTTSLGPSQKVYLTDRAAMTASWRRRWFADTRSADPLDPDSVPAELRIRGDEYEMELGYRWNWRSAFAIAGGFTRFDDGVSEDGDPVVLPVGSITLAFPMSSNSDGTLRATRSYVNTAAAVIEGLGSTAVEGKWQGRNQYGSSLEGRGTLVRYDDDNRRATGTVNLMQRLSKEPELQIGYRFRYDHVFERSPLFYTPDRFVGHDSVLHLSVGNPDRHFSAEAAYGSGRELDGAWQRQVSLLGTGRLQFSPAFGLYLNGGVSQAADFRSRHVIGGLSFTF